MDRERISRNGPHNRAGGQRHQRCHPRQHRQTTFIDQGLQFNDINVQLAAAETVNSADLERIQIRTDDRQHGCRCRTSPGFERYNTGPSNILRINSRGARGYRNTGAIWGNIDLQTANQPGNAAALNPDDQWPDSYRFEIGGTADEQRQSFIFLLIAFIVAATLAYMVMASQFESLLEPFIIIFTIPLALSGVFAALAISGTPVSVTALIGLILLSGIVVNNGIVMIDYIKILQARGLSREKAIITGASRRLRPIIMTAATTILCMIPLAFELGEGAETWSPMARTVIGGLTASTILMLFFRALPVLPVQPHARETRIQHQHQIRSAG